MEVFSIFLSTKFFHCILNCESYRKMFFLVPKVESTTFMLKSGKITSQVCYSGKYVIDLSTSFVVVNFNGEMLY